jgi:hypothetical protein
VDDVKISLSELFFLSKEGIKSLHGDQSTLTRSTLQNENQTCCYPKRYPKQSTRKHCNSDEPSSFSTVFKQKVTSAHSKIAQIL